MRLITFGSLLIPDQALAIVFVFGALALMVGATRIASAMFLFVFASIFLPALIGPFIELVPTWVIILGLAYLAFLIPFFMVSLLEVLVVPALGRRTASEMSGHIASRTAIWALSAPFRLVRALYSAVARLWRAT